MIKTKNLALAGLFIAIMLILGYFEKLMNLGLGFGIKLGLSNSVLLLCLYWFSVPMTFTLMLAKVLLTSLLFGGANPTALSLSFAGGLISLIGMALMVNVVKDVSPITAGVVGGVLHNVGQMAVAVLVWSYPLILFQIGLLVIVGGVMGGITGSIVLRMKHLLPYERRKQLGFVTKPDAPKPDSRAQ